MTIRRRTFLGALTAALSPLPAAKLSSIGAQLYTLRNVLPAQPLQTLQALEKLGYQEVEAVGGGLPQIWDALRQTKLTPVSVHLDVPLFFDKMDDLPAAIERMKEKGFRYVVCPWVPPAVRNAESMKRLGENLNRAGKLAQAAGMTLCYHNHAFEFAPLGNSTILDQLMEQTDPQLVRLELDIMWAQVAGVDPAQLIARYRGRVPLLHLKNVAAGIAQRFDERVPREAFKEVNAGVIDMVQVLRAARAAGVKHYFVEQDQTPGDPLASLEISINYLRALEF